MSAWRWVALYLLGTGLLYGLATHFPAQAPLHVPSIHLDATIPLLPWTSVPYLSYFLLLPLLVYAGARRPWFAPAFFAACLASAVTLTWHLIVPTAAPRTPALEEASLLGLIQSLDSPLGAFPSLHVGLPLALSVVLAAARTRWALAYAAWTAVLAIAALTTKQHVVLDILGGALVGLAAGAFTVACQRMRTDFRTLGMLGLEWLVILLVFVAALRYDAGWGYALAFVLIATRQHALLMLYHDAVHGLLARNPRANDFLINALVGVPHLLPVEVYRPLHFAHHRELGTQSDPERRFLYVGQFWRYRPLPAAKLLVQLLGDLLVVNGVLTIAAWSRSGMRPSFSGGTVAIGAVWAVLLACLAVAFPRAALIVAILWFGPLLTLTNLLQKLRSFAEHSGGPYETPGWPHWTYSWRPGLLGRLTVWPYNINLHHEHHSAPFAPWHALPALAEPEAMHLPGHSLLGLIWKR
jgi:fatty acid desaturase